MQQQQQADFDLLAVFPDETKAEAAVAKLHKEGFDDSEVHQLTAGAMGTGQFREHGPNRNREQIFLQTQRSGPHPVLILVLAIVGGLLVGGLSFAASFAFPRQLPEPTALIAGIAIGIVIGAIIGLLRRGRVRGAIGQTENKQPPQEKRVIDTARGGARTVVALRFTDPENISRNSRARAILLNNQGKIDRSVEGRT